MGALSLPSERFARFGNPAWPGIRTANFAAFWPWSGALSKSQTVNKVVNSPRRKGRVCAGNPRRVSCAIEILSFQNFYRVLKTCSAGRKDFFDTPSLRNSDALMRVAVPRRRGPAGLRDLFCFCRNCGLYTLHSWPFRVCEARGGITALRASETLDARLSKGLICRFLRSGGRSSPHDSCFLANTQNFLPTAPVANAFTLWYDGVKKSSFCGGFL